MIDRGQSGVSAQRLYELTLYIVRRSALVLICSLAVTAIASTGVAPTGIVSSNQTTLSTAEVTAQSGSPEFSVESESAPVTSKELEFSISGDSANINEVYIKYDKKDSGLVSTYAYEKSLKPRSGEQSVVLSDSSGIGEVSYQLVAVTENNEEIIKEGVFTIYPKYNENRDFIQVTTSELRRDNSDKKTEEFILREGSAKIADQSTRTALTEIGTKTSLSTKSFAGVAGKFAGLFVSLLFSAEPGNSPTRLNSKAFNGEQTVSDQRFPEPEPISITHGEQVGVSFRVSPGTLIYDEAEIIVSRQETNQRDVIRDYEYIEHPAVDDDDSIHTGGIIKQPITFRNIEPVPPGETRTYDIKIVIKSLGQIKKLTHYP